MLLARLELLARCVLSVLNQTAGKSLLLMGEVKRCLDLTCRNTFC